MTNYIQKTGLLFLAALTTGIYLFQPPYSYLPLLIPAGYYVTKRKHN